jgi:hypothetical protein
MSKASQGNLAQPQYSATLREGQLTEKHTGFFIAIYGTPWTTNGVFGSLALPAEDTNGVLAVMPCGSHVLVENSAALSLARLAITGFEQSKIFVVCLTHGALLFGNIFP